MKNFNKLLLLIFLFIGQNTSAKEYPFKTKDMVFGSYTGFKGEMNIHYYSYMSPLMGVAFDYGLPYKIDSGFFSIGIVAGVRNAENYHIYPISQFGKLYYFDRNWKWVSFTVRAAYHIDLLDIKELDTYVGGIFSYFTTQITSEDNLYTDPNMLGNPYPLKPRYCTKYGLMIGARYDFYKSFGAFGEVSTGITNFAFGITYKI